MGDGLSEPTKDPEEAERRRARKERPAPVHHGRPAQAMSRRSRLALGLLLVLLSGFQGSAELTPPEGYLGKFVWRMADPAFGGFSGIEVLEGGLSFITLSDKAAFVIGEFDRDTEGHVTGIRAGKMLRLLDAKTGKPLVGWRTDSEGLAVDKDGNAFVSFENRPSVARLDLKTGATTDVKRHPDFAKLPRNGALEALAIGENQTLYTVPERPDSENAPVYRWQDGDWDTQLQLPRRGGFAAVAADILDNRLYLLEREFRLVGGFSSRLRRFDISEAGLSAETTLIVTPMGMFDNLEGLSVWRDSEIGRAHV